ncbi:glycosyltransferase family 39 protein [Streptomyces sp. TG1A-8]|uniref:glycosyltransferase family 39 protein n=1 Tax=Streptomyces sp. TG1A-8 TaxID=3051385 RepID=UPI00265C04A8|nr:glycosyltransferase family 39 protein [Streptomyces sp. TG1A-8]MDO0927454.1 glycosyltransferase family 39 protein [Streptomyces sp. TG1A-8]
MNVGPLVEPQSRQSTGAAAVVPDGATARGTSRAPSRVRRALAVSVPALVMLALGLWGLDRGGMWRDEAVTFQVARRTVPQIWRLLHGVDAVHGLYYLLMHAVLAVHPGEVVLRLPSVGAAAVTAGLVAALGTRLGRPRVGLWAGLLYATTPMAAHYAQEGRSYALVAAGATGATLLFVRAVRGGSWWAYGTLLGLTCWLHEFAVLLLPAHAGSLVLARAGAAVWRGWGRAAGAVGAALVPMALASHAQSAQVAWLRKPTAETAQGLLRAFLGPTDGVYWVCLALALLGAATVVGRPGEVTLAGVALPLAVVPPAGLMLVSQVSPLYVDRYVLYALSGAPLLVACGADRAAGAVRHLRGRPSPAAPAPPGRTAALPGPARLPLAGVLVLALALAHQVPRLRDDHDPGRRPDDLAAVSRAVAREVRAGEGVVFVPVQARNAALAYPGAFRGVRDVALVEPGAGSGTLYGREAGPRALRRDLARLDRVWVVADRGLLAGRWRPHGPVERTKLDVLARDFVPGRESVRGKVTVRLYVRRAGALSAPAFPPAPRRPARS